MKYSAMKYLILVIAVFCPQVFFAQTYQPNWESLDKRPTPQWYKDGKFGIFIHWGVYAVPGWCSKGNYAEWYQEGLQTTDTARMKYHEAKFGNRTYYDLAKDFKAELFNPDDWAKLFEKSGATYIVLTSKHHDGFALWPSKEASSTWGFPWNAAETGPKRDLLGDLFTAVRKTSVHAGMYYSLYEWFNPLWKSDPSKYATTHVWPQMKDLITHYQPDVFWTDGDWDAPPETWKSQEFLAWLYNESPVKDKIVVNDRWGSGTRFNHGGIYTPEYQPNLDFENHDWEESRGMGFSYGYNREEDAWDYNSTQSLVIALIDKVSRGGNFLLDIGPDEHGKIPPIMQERLLQIGDWLKINGEAIYNTTRWKVPSQWSAGNRNYVLGNQHIPGDWKTSGDIMLKLTVDPDSGYAVKEVFYTYNPTSNSLYAIFPKYPSNRKLVLHHITLPAGTAISFLSTKEKLSWKQSGDDVEISLPEYDPNKITAPYSYAVKIENFGRYAPRPEVKYKYETGSLQPTLLINAAPGTRTYYTNDGTDPSDKSILYTGPVLIKNDCLIKAISVLDTRDSYALPSAIGENELRTYQWMNAVKTKSLSPGITYKYYEPPAGGDVFFSMIDNNETASGVTDHISVDLKKRAERFVFQFSGYIKIEKDGIYTFYTESDDGSKLYIDNTVAVDNSGYHPSQERQGRMALRKGYHKFQVVYFDGGGENSLKVSIQPEGGEKMAVTGLLYH